MEEAKDALAGLLGPDPDDRADPGAEAPAPGGAELPAGTRAALRLLAVLTLTGLQEPQAAAAARAELADWLGRQPEGFELDWTFAGTRHFIATSPLFAHQREGLLHLIAAADQGRDALLQALEQGARQ